MKTKRAVLTIVLLAVYWPLLFVATHTVLDYPFPLRIVGHDKTLHFCAYVLLALLYWLARYGTQRPDPRTRRFYINLAFFAAYAALDEFTQKFVHRSCDPADWLCDVGGVLTAFFLLFALRRTLHWLIAYWITLFVITHWPQSQGAFLILPPSWRQFEPAFTFLAYIALTLLWWRSLCPQPRFIINRNIVLATLTILPAYSLFDETISLIMHRGFDTTDLIVAWAGIILGGLCAAAFALHHLANPPYPD